MLREMLREKAREMQKMDGENGQEENTRLELELAFAQADYERNSDLLERIKTRRDESLVETRSPNRVRLLQTASASQDADANRLVRMPQSGN